MDEQKTTLPPTLNPSPSTEEGTSTPLPSDQMEVGEGKNPLLTSPAGEGGLLTHTSSPLQGGGLRRGLNPLNLALILGSLIPLYHLILFVHTYNRNIPLADQWRFSIHIAAAAKSGTLVFSNLTEGFNGHRFFFTNLSTAIFSVLTDWNISQEMWLNVLLAVINFALLVSIFYAQDRQRAIYCLVPFSMLVFYLYQDENWIIASQNQWHFAVLFLLAPLAVVVHHRPGWRPVLAAIALIIGGVFSLATGIMGWALLPVVMWLLGYRKWGYFILWIGIAGVITYLYLHNLDQGVEGDKGWATLGVTDFPSMIRYVINYLGVPFAGKENNAVPYGVLGLLAVSVNLWLLRDQPRLFAPWLALIGYALGSGLIIALGRLHIGFTEAHPRYNTHALLLWIALAALMLLNSQSHKFGGETSGTSTPLPRQGEGIKGWGSWATTFNTLIALLLVALYFRSNYAFLQLRYSVNPHPMGVERTGLWGDEECILRYPLIRDATCYGSTEQNQEAVYYLAAYRLAIFADQPTVNVLPETYQAGSPILIQSPNEWLNVYIRDWMLKGIAEADQLHLAPPGKFTSASTLPNPLDHLLPTDDKNAVQQFINDAAQVWVISTPETEEQNTTLSNFLAEQGYIGTPYPIQEERYRLANFSIYRFQKPPADTKTILYFGEEAIALEAWSINAETVAPCDNLRLQSWWRSAVVPQFNYSTTAVLIAPDGNPIAQKDAAIGDTLMQLWQPEQFYFDERILTIPCDAAPGEYTLTFGMYLNTGSGFEDLPAYDTDGKMLGTRAPITSLIIE